MSERKKIRAWFAAAACAALLGSGCGSDGGTDPTAPQPGQLTVSVATTAAQGAAYLLTLSGTDMTNPVAVGGGQLFTFPASASQLKTAVIGPAMSGPLMKFSVPDVNRATGYSVTLNEVAGPDNQLLPVTNYQVTIGR